MGGGALERELELEGDGRVEGLCEGIMVDSAGDSWFSVWALGIVSLQC